MCLLEQQELDDPLFSQNGSVLTAHSLMKQMRSWLSQAGVLDPDQYSLHSLCRGGETWAFVSGIPEKYIKVLGDWASDVYRQYLDYNLDTRIEAMRTFTKLL